MYAQAAAEVAVKCFHCGNECEEERIVFYEKSFCCSGCRTVFEILNDNNLCDYYELNSVPGVSLKNTGHETSGWLDENQFSKRFILFESTDRVQVKFIIPAIHCSSCVWLLENLSRLDKSIISSRVRFREQEVMILYDPAKIKLSGVVSLLQQIGYSPDLHRDINSEKNKKPVYFTKKYILRLGVAFFCFGNIMLLSFPEYLGIDTNEDDLYRHYFGYLNFVLILPVIFFSATEFFVSAYNGLKNKVLNMDVPIALGIIVMFLLSTYLIFTKTGAGYMDTLASLVFLMLLGRSLQNITYARISFERDHRSYFPLAVTVEQQGKEKVIPVNELAEKHLLIMHNNEIIPANGISMSEDAFFDYSFVTGESKPVRKSKGDLIYAGGKLISGSARVEITQRAEQSYLNSLWDNDVISKKENAFYFETLSNRISYWFTLIILAIASAGAVFWYFTDPSVSWLVFTSVLIITCPCALALSTPFTLGNAMVILGRNKFYLKSTQVIEQLKKINVIMVDKTGTLTYAAKNEVIWNGDKLSDEEKILIASLVKNSVHPLSKSVYKYLHQSQISDSYSFTEKPSKGISAFVDFRLVKAGTAGFAGFNDSGNPGTSTVYISIDNIPKGYFSISNSYRKGLQELMDMLKKNYEIHLISGDSDFEKEKLEKILGKNVKMNFNMSPGDKMNYVKQLQASGKKVMMIGDGLNDVGALRQSNVGLAVTDEVNNFSPACDVILSADNFSRLNSYLKFSKAAVRVVIASIIISFLYNGIGIYYALTGSLSPVVAAILMPVSSVSVILFTTISVWIISKNILQFKN